MPQDWARGACIAPNTANEIAVEAFWQKKICLTDIAVIVKACLDDKTIAQDYSQDFGDEVLGLERILTMDKKVRKIATAKIKLLKQGDVL